jgi:nucleoid DNA-binding protein
MTKASTVTQMFGKTVEPLAVPAKYAPKFGFSSGFKNAVNDVPIK